MFYQKAFSLFKPRHPLLCVCVCGGGEEISSLVSKPNQYQSSSISVFFLFSGQKVKVASVVVSVPPSHAGCSPLCCLMGVQTWINPWKVLNLILSQFIFLFDKSSLDLLAGQRGTQGVVCRLQEVMEKWWGVGLPDILGGNTERRTQWRWWKWWAGWVGWGVL